MLLLTLALIASATPPGTPPVPERVRAAVSGALAIPDGAVEVVDVQGTLPSGCVLQRAEVQRPIAGSGREALHLFGGGYGCDAWAWVRVRVTAPALVTTRAVARGTRLDGAVAAQVLEVISGRPRLSSLPEGAVAEHQLAAGTPLDQNAIRIGPTPGETVSVVLRAGVLTVEQKARALPCRRDRACALLPSGQRVEGYWHGGRIELEQP